MTNMKDILNGLFPIPTMHGCTLQDEHELLVSLPEGWVVFIDEHPEGVDRGGYRPKVLNTQTKEMWLYEPVDGIWECYNEGIR